MSCGETQNTGKVTTEVRRGTTGTSVNPRGKKHTHPVDEKGLCELDHLQSDQQADGDQVVVQDDECQQVIRKVSGDVTYTNTQYSSICSHMTLFCIRWRFRGRILTGAGQVPAGILSVLFVPDGGTHRADQGHDQQDAKQDEDLQVGHPLHVRALQRRFGGVLRGGGHVNESNM